MPIVLLGDSHLARVRRDLASIGTDVRNAARGGASVLDLRAQAAEVTAEDTVVVSVGTNDAAPWKRVELSRFIETLRATLDTIAAHRLIYLTPPGVDEARLTGTRDRTNAVIDEYRTAALAEFTGRSAQIVHAERVIAPLGPDAFDDDGLHLSGSGYRVVLPAIADAAHS